MYEVKLPYKYGNTTYFRIRNDSGQVYSKSTGTFEDWLNANVIVYGNVLVDKGGGLYLGHLPVLAVGRYVISCFLQAGDNPAIDDIGIGPGEIVWNGTSEESIIDNYGYVKAGGWG